MKPSVPVAAILALIFVPLGGCGSADGAAQKGSAGRDGGRASVEVGFVTVTATSVAQTTELTGRVAALQIAEVRPQAAGVIRARRFTEGSIVRAGQTLYQIDAEVYRAAADQAQANLDSARANAAASAARAERLRPLAAMEAVAQQDFTDATAAARAGRAAIAQNQATLEGARINLRFTRVPAPISGRIGRSSVTQGALVTANQVEPLAVIQRLDPVFVDVQQSTGDLLRLRRALAQGGAVPTRAEVRLKLEDGSDYPVTGSVEFAETIVDPATGTVTLRARFANPSGLLLPGMFVRARFAQAIDTTAFLVPQAALTRDPTGQASVLIVEGNKAVPRKVTAARTDGANWVVTDGLRAGDRVITQGTGKLRPNATIRAVPADTPQRVAPPKRG